jgi:hypothetical protein
VKPVDSAYCGKCSETVDRFTARHHHRHLNAINPGVADQARAVGRRTTDSAPSGRADRNEPAADYCVPEANGDTRRGPRSFSVIAVSAMLDADTEPIRTPDAHWSVCGHFGTASTAPAPPRHAA